MCVHKMIYIYISACVCVCVMLLEPAHLQADSYCRVFFFRCLAHWLMHHDWGIHWEYDNYW